MSDRTSSPTALDPQQEVERCLAVRRGHFALESGHHGALWLDLETLCIDPRPVRALATRLAARIETYRPDAICGPLVEGAFVALLVAEQLGLPFVYTERRRKASPESLYPFEYRLAPVLVSHVADRRVAIVNDVVSAGSAVLETHRELQRAGASPVVIGTLLVLGTQAEGLARSRGVVLESLARLPGDLWEPARCPLCAIGEPLVTEPVDAASGSGRSTGSP
ncbi:orotate phosphoribosyltransferase [Candidatus Binatia bacterium]|nr:orotate phosphoribosyltransferase [Candidatus Binatia bacterium]